MKRRIATHEQHFLRDPRLVAELIGHTSIKKSDIVYDLGAGSGVISSVLARRVKEVVAVESEPRTAAKLRENMSVYNNVTVIEDDILKLPLPADRYSIFANIPFSLSSRIVQHFTAQSHPPVTMCLIVQKQFARKLLQHEGFTGALGASIAPWFEVAIRRPLKRSDFWPAPAVDTVLVEIRPRKQIVLPKEKRADFNQFVGRGYSEQKWFATLPLRRADIPPALRPSQLSVEQWVRLFRAANQK